MLNHLAIPEDLGFWFFLDVSLKATLLLLLTALVVALMSRSSSAVRHRVWVLSLTALLVLPAVIALAPQWAWQVIPRQWQQTPAVVQNALSHTNPDLSQPDTPKESDLVAVAEVANVGTEDVPTVQMTEPALPAIDIIPPGAESVHTVQLAGESAADQTSATPSTDGLLLIWLCGALLALVPLMSGLLGNLRLRMRGRRLVDPKWQRLVATLSDRLGLQRQVTLLLSGPQQMPMTFGLWRPCVVLPCDAPQWLAERRQVVLLHELAHVKRNDVPLQILARFACSLYWFHPLVWWAMRRLRLEREHACDDCVLETGQEADRYATELLELAHSHPHSPIVLNAALSMARRSQLEGRLLAVLDTHRCRAPVNTVRTGGLTLLALALVVSLGIVRPALEAETRVSESENDSATAVVSQDPAADTRNQLVLTGTVLSPECKPVAGASVEVIAYNRMGWSRNLPSEDEVDYYQAQTDGTGRFRLVLPRNISRPRRFMGAIASKEGLLTAQTIDPRLARSHLELKLHASKVVRLQLIDTAGNPVVGGIEPRLRYVSLQDGGSLGMHPSQKAYQMVSGWPRFSRSDKEGYVSITVPSSTKQLALFIDDERVGSHSLRLNISDEPLSAVLKPVRFLNGKVTDADSGKPIAGAEVVVIEDPYRRVRTKVDGSFRVARGTTVATLFLQGESIIHVYPPRDTDFLFQALEWKWPNEGIGDAELSIGLQRGIVVTGQVVEKGTGKPVAEAAVYFDPQRKNNPSYRKSARSRFSGSDMKYITDAQGRFRMPVWPGPGYLLVHAPTLDYVHVQVSMGAKWYGKPGLQREYHGGALRLNLKPDETPQPLKIELERGVMLRRKVVRPDGRPANGKAYARSYLHYKDDIRGSLPAVPVEKGVLELPGFEPKVTNPIFIVDFEHHCGATVSPTALAVNLANPPIQLQQCGAAKFRFVNDKGNALADYEPMLLLIVTPGAPAPHYFRPDQPLWSDSMIWQNVARPAKVPKTDANGRVTVKDLIPGATYRLSFINAKGNWAEGYKFTVRPGETTDVGEVALPQSD